LTAIRFQEKRDWMEFLGVMDVPAFPDSKENPALQVSIPSIYIFI
jgi:hypothetical protein